MAYITADFSYAVFECSFLSRKNLKKYFSTGLEKINISRGSLASPLYKDYEHFSLSNDIRFLQVLELLEKCWNLECLSRTLGTSRKGKFFLEN